MLFLAQKTGDYLLKGTYIYSEKLNLKSLPWPFGGRTTYSLDYHEGRTLHHCQLQLQQQRQAQGYYVGAPRMKPRRRYR